MGAPGGPGGAEGGGGERQGLGGLSAVRRAFSGMRGSEPDRSRAPVGVSAVLIPVFPDREGDAGEPGGGVRLLYTQRSPHLRRHPGEISFPGGRVDPEDKDPLAAALRETEEEVGIAPHEVEIVGHLTDYLTYHNVLVCTYVGLVEARPPPTEPRSREEVARVFTLPVARLLDASCYECRRLPEMPPDRVVHYWHVQPQAMWGVTGEITARFLHRVYGWQPPCPPRIIDDVGEFNPSR